MSDSGVWEESSLSLAIVGVLAQSPRSGADVYRVVSGRLDSPPAKSTVYKTLSRLEDGGYVKTVETPHNDRANEYRATKAGQEAVRKYVGNVLAWLDTTPQTR